MVLLVTGIAEVGVGVKGEARESQGGWVVADAQPTIKLIKTI